PRRHHPRPQRRRQDGVRRAHARRVRDRRPSPRLALRRRLEPGQDRTLDHSADRAESRAACAADRARPENRGMNQRPLLPWTLSFLQPYRGRVALLAVLLASEIALGALQPWPMAVVIDYVLTPAIGGGGKAFPAWLQPFIASVAGENMFLLL